MSIETVRRRPREADLKPWQKVRQCLAREISAWEQARAAWEQARSDAGATIRWMFPVEMARTTVARHDPDIDDQQLCPTVQAA